MLYRVVLQGHAAAGAELDEVKRNFVRVTALPLNVTEQLFDGTSKVLKRQASEADAERIAQTLRAIGAPATVLPEPTLPGGVAVLEAPTSSAVTAQRAPAAHPCSPATTSATDPDAASTAIVATPPVEQPTSRRRRFALAVAAVPLAIAVVIAVPSYQDWVRRWRSGAVAATAARKPAAETPTVQKPRTFDRSLLEGPWRCTDQTTGVSTYWQYVADGTLHYHGDNVTHGEQPSTGPDVPVRWTIDDDRLTWTYDARPSLRLTLSELSLLHLDYRNQAQDLTRCLRP